MFSRRIATSHLSEVLQPTSFPWPFPLLRKRQGHGIEVVLQSGTFKGHYQQQVLQKSKPKIHSSVDGSLFQTLGQ